MNETNVDILRNKDTQILNNILKISEMLKFDLYGIRNRVTDKVIDLFLDFYESKKLN